MPGQNYNFFWLFTVISGTILYRSYFGEIFCCHRSGTGKIALDPFRHSRAQEKILNNYILSYFARDRDKIPD